MSAEGTIRKRGAEDCDIHECLDGPAGAGERRPTKRKLMGELGN